MEPRAKAPRYEAGETETSVNAIFSLTGPRAGVLHIRNDTAPGHAETLHDSELSVLSGCFGAVAVPVDQYWRAASQHSGLLFPAACGDAAAASRLSSSSGLSLITPAAIRRPDPKDIPRSFYARRLDAVSHRHYVVDHGALLIAADNHRGTSGKMFNTLLRDELVSFVEAIPLCHQRNLYIVLDADAAVDPFFDIDCSLPFDWMDTEGGEKMAGEKGSEATAPLSSSLSSSASSSSSLSHTMTIVVEQWLGQILQFLRDKVEAAMGARLQHCLVLTSSVLVQDEDGGGNGENARYSISSRDSKLSFHVHFRLDSNAVFANVKELHHFMVRVREELDESLLRPENPDRLRFYRMLRRCIDFGVYTRWRAFRLPYNTKIPPPHVFFPSDAAGLELLISSFSNFFSNSVSVPDLDVGAVAFSVVNLIDLSTLQHMTSVAQQEQQRRMITKLFFLFRFLLPILPGKTPISDKNLMEFLSRYAPHISSDGMTERERRQEVARAVFDLALIQRKRSDAAGQKTEPLSLRFIATDRATAAQENEKEPCNPFFVPRPPHCDGVRVPVRDAQVKDLVAEVFRCLCVAYDGVGDKEGAYPGHASSPIVGNRISVQYQDGIRAYYAQQKLSKFCLDQGREHRATYPQLYLTYGSIKLRCYSNDCHRRCLALRWSVDDDEKVAGRAAVLLPVDGRGYPKYGRLAQLRHLLFPPLPPEELLKRYGVGAVETAQR